MLRASGKWFRDRVEAQREEERNWRYYDKSDGIAPSDGVARRVWRHLEIGIRQGWGVPEIHMVNGDRLIAYSIGDNHVEGVECFYAQSDPDQELFDAVIFVQHIARIQWIDA